MLPCSLVAQSCLTLCHPTDCSPLGSSVHGILPGKNAGVCCHFLLQGIFPTKGLNLGLLHCSQILYRLSHQGSPLLLIERVILARNQMKLCGVPNFYRCFKGLENTWGGGGSTPTHTSSPDNSSTFCKSIGTQRQQAIGESWVKQ